MLLKITIILCYSTIRINNYYQIIPLTKRHCVKTPLSKRKKRLETRLMWAVGWRHRSAGIQAGSFLDTFQRMEKYRTNYFHRTNASTEGDY